MGIDEPGPRDHLPAHLRGDAQLITPTGTTGAIPLADLVAAGFIPELDDETACYACLVGVWTGPESHTPGCSMSNSPASDNGVESAREVHYIHYEDTSAYDGRQAWECTTCSSSGSVGEFGDPEAAAERSHARSGVTSLGTTTRRAL